MRVTQQRDAISRALVNAGRSLSIREIFELAQHEVSGLGIATVYRNLKALQSEGLVVKVDLPGQPPRWEVAGERHHHHFLCRTCDRLFEVLDCPEGVMRVVPQGYTLEEHYILLRGQCNVCAGPTKSTRPRSASKAIKPSPSKQP